MTDTMITLDDFEQIMLPAFERILYLKMRWNDEKEYEDFADYIGEMKKLISTGWVFVAATKRPFGFKMASSTQIANVTATNRAINLDLRRF
jgi:hypothetical protein